MLMASLVPIIRIHLHGPALPAILRIRSLCCPASAAPLLGYHTLAFLHLSTATGPAAPPLWRGLLFPWLRLLLLLLLLILAPVLDTCSTPTAPLYASTCALCTCTPTAPLYATFCAPILTDFRASLLIRLRVPQPHTWEPLSRLDLNSRRSLLSAELQPCSSSRCCMCVNAATAAAAAAAATWHQDVHGRVGKHSGGRQQQQVRLLLSLIQDHTVSASICLMRYKLRQSLHLCPFRCRCRYSGTIPCGWIAVPSYTPSLFRDPLLQ
mmetsp:Transcript_20975/g.54706  ORF Transcript_20975/g.54706 Transcript_20975/m.54706 type:complete len:266 (-) Transcript_20975:301-1098(-)